MRIVDYNTFVKLPTGTMYCETVPCVFGEIKIKHETINEEKDWFLQCFQGNIESENGFRESYNKLLEGKEVNLDLGTLERDGMFDYDRKFAIYSQKDIQDMINKLQSVLNK